MSGLKDVDMIEDRVQSRTVRLVPAVRKENIFTRPLFASFAIFGKVFLLFLLKFLYREKMAD